MNYSSHMQCQKWFSSQNNLITSTADSTLLPICVQDLKKPKVHLAIYSSVWPECFLWFSIYHQRQLPQIPVFDQGTSMNMFQNRKLMRRLKKKRELEDVHKTWSTGHFAVSLTTKLVRLVISVKIGRCITAAVRIVKVFITWGKLSHYIDAALTEEKNIEAFTVQRLEGGQRSILHLLHKSSNLAIN